MSKKNKKTVYEQPVEEVKAEAAPAKDERFIPDDKLQSYYNEAYINERDRLNAMFGRLDTYPVVEEKIVYRDPDLTGYVPVEKYNKKKRCATAMTVLFVLALAAAIVFAVLKFIL